MYKLNMLLDMLLRQTGCRLQASPRARTPAARRCVHALGASSQRDARDENPAHENARSELPLQVTYSNSKIKCDICDKTFPKNCKLKRHYEAVHMKLKPFKCEFCQQNFTQKGDMKRHVESIHQQAEIYECSLCSKIFTSVKDFKLHYVKIHTDFTPPKENPNKEHFACNHCSIKFPRKSTLNGHINTVHLRQTIEPSNVQ